MENDCPEILEKNKRRVCSVCGVEKDLTVFPKNKDCKEGRRATCNECSRKVKKRWSDNNPEKVRSYLNGWRKKHSEYFNGNHRQYVKYFSNNKEKVYASMRRTEAKNPEKYRMINLICNRRWKKNNPEKAKEISRKSCIKRRKDPQVKLHARITSSINRSLHGNKQGRSWESLVGYTCLDLRCHLERLFLPGMTWEGMREWHVDHKRPVSSFKFSSPEDEDFKLCWCLDNLQPLWALDNIKKGN
jgi:hypothetical protein